MSKTSTAICDGVCYVHYRDIEIYVNAENGKAAFRRLLSDEQVFSCQWVKDETLSEKRLRNGLTVMKILLARTVGAVGTNCPLDGYFLETKTHKLVIADEDGEYLSFKLMAKPYQTDELTYEKFRAEQRSSAAMTMQYMTQALSSAFGVVWSFSNNGREAVGQ